MCILFKDLIEELKSETSGSFKKLLTALMMNPVEYDCLEIRKAVQVICKQITWLLLKFY